MKYEMLEMLQLCVDEGASDLHLRVDAAPMLRIHGALTPIDGDPLDEEDTLELAKVITTEEQFAEVNERGGCDFAYAFEDQARFRVSVFKERGRFGLALRLIPNALLTLQQIGLPEQVRELLFKPRGLVLVTGPTGSGKSTTLASMLNIINEQRDCHIITVEDPIEYYHANKKSLVTQREIGNDVPSFSESIRRALRQDPDVILIGEMRDLETMQAAITAAETGHLVFATLHTTGAATTVDRIVDAFPTEQQPQVRTQLSVSISAIISATTRATWLLLNCSEYSDTVAIPSSFIAPAIFFKTLLSRASTSMSPYSYPFSSCYLFASFASAAYISPFISHWVLPPPSFCILTTFTQPPSFFQSSSSAYLPPSSGSLYNCCISELLA